MLVPLKTLFPEKNENYKYINSSRSLSVSAQLLHTHTLPSQPPTPSSERL